MNPVKIKIKPILCAVLILWSQTVAASSIEQLSVEQLSSHCEKSLQTTVDSASLSKNCRQLETLGQQGNADAYYQLGKLLSQNEQNKRQHKKGLFMLVLAADENHKQAVETLSHYVKGKMTDGKIPLHLSHYVSYVEAHWKQTGQPKDHHFAAYNRWLEKVELAFTEPEKLSALELTHLAVDFENGYFVGENPQKAIELFAMAASKGIPFAQFKTADGLYDRNPELALTLYHQAATGDSSEAMMALGDHYGCNNNQSLALKWYNQAMQAGSEYAEDEIEAVKTTGKPSQCR